MQRDKFTTTITIRRMMTANEARERALDMGLSEDLADWLEGQFAEANDYHDEFVRDNASDWDYEELQNRGVGENGRAAYGQSWENQAEELAEAMGLDRDAGLFDQDPEFERVWNAFFEE